jgi:pimeloyl-ACP methyl ester carboxylesterase
VNIIIPITITLVLLIIIAVMTVNYLAKYISDAFVFAEMKSMEYTLQKSIENGNFSMEELSAYQLTPFTVESDYGYMLTGVYREGEDPRKAMIFVHGHTWSWHGQVKYFRLYSERGYTIIAYNHRGHGDSDGENCSAGYFEKYDLDRIVRWTRARFPRIETLGLMGESMGAATALQYIPIAEHISFIHADCPYSSMRKLYDHKLRQRHIPGFLRLRIIAKSRKYIERSAGFDSFEVEPEQAIMKQPIPLLLIHGGDDTYVPTWMSQQMYEKRKDYAPTYLSIIEHAVHAQSFMTDPKQYESVVDEFLSRYESG